MPSLFGQKKSAAENLVTKTENSLEPQLTKKLFTPRVSLKWQLSIALISLSMGLVGCYVMLAKETFESDKIAYVFETRQSQLDFLAKELSRKLERGMRDANSVLIGFDQNTKQLNSMAQKLFDSQSSLLAVEVTDNSGQETMLRVLKYDSLKEDLLKSISLPNGLNYFSQIIDSTRYIVQLRENNANQLIIKAIIEIPEAITQKSSQGVLALIDDGRVISTTKKLEIPIEFAKELSNEVPILSG